MPAHWCKQGSTCTMHTPTTMHHLVQPWTDAACRRMAVAQSAATPDPAALLAGPLQCVNGLLPVLLSWSVCLCVCLCSRSSLMFDRTRAVHEKTILFPLLPMLMLHDAEPFVAVWFTIVATFSLWPLLAKARLLFDTTHLNGAGPRHASILGPHAAVHPARRRLRPHRSACTSRDDHTGESVLM